MSSSEVVIIGGGINGVSTAFQLAKQGANVTLLEKSFIAGGPTGHSSAIIRQHYSNEVTARMALNSLRTWQNFGEVVGGECGYTPSGFLMTVQPQDVDGLKASIAMQQALGIQTQFVSPDEIRDIEPHLDTDALGGGAYEPEGGYCDPTTAANAFARAAKDLCAAIRSGVTATHIKQEGGRVVGVETSAGFFPAGAVVVAAGPWSQSLLAHLGVDVPIITARIKIGIFRRPDEFENHMVCADFVSQVYMRPETGGLMLVGSISPDEAEDRAPDPDNFNEKVEMDTLVDFGERATQRYPLMAQSHVASHYASLYDITPDWHPILDAVPGNQGLYLCAGSSGHGFKLAPATGEMMANLVLHGKQPDDDINLFAYDRFATGNPITGAYEYSIVG